MVKELLDAVEDRDEIDIARDLAYQLPLNVISTLIGVPREDRGVLQRTADAQLALTCENPTNGDFVVQVQKAMEELQAYIKELSAERRANPRDDVISKLATATVQDRSLDEEEVVNLTVLLLLAGHLTTMSLLGNMMLTLIEHPGQLAEVRAPATSASTRIPMSSTSGATPTLNSPSPQASTTASAPTWPVSRRGSRSTRSWIAMPSSPSPGSSGTPRTHSAI